MELAQQLKQLLQDDERVSTSTSLREQHGRDLTYHAPRLPDVVVFPKSTEEVSRVLAFANENKIPVVPFGAGSSLEGHVIPVMGGISLDMTLMDQVIELRPEDFVARVQPGLRRQELNRRLKKYGLFFPVDPGADATIGGMAATNASGTNAVRYGVMKDRVLGLEVVLADGRVVRTGSMAVKSSAGYQLTNLFVGSEGTLGVITEVTLKLAGLPEATVAARAVFNSVDEAGQAAVDMIHSGLMIGRVELVDALTIRAVNRSKETDYPEQPTLFLEFSGRQNSIEEDVQFAKELAEQNNVQLWTEERDPEQRAKLWEARHEAGLAVMALYPGTKHMTTDVCVPISLLPESLKKARELIEQYKIEAAIFGHVGDGNYHVSFNFDPNNQSELEKAKAVNEAIVKFAIENGGTCTGEHGIGLGKVKYLEQQYEQAVPIMASIKNLFDPNGILNPGKVLSRELLSQIR